MARGVLELIGLAATVALAVPIGLFGLEALASGRPIGAAFVALAVALVALEEYVVRPSDLPGEAAGRVVGAVVKEPEDDE